MTSFQGYKAKIGGKVCWVVNRNADGSKLKVVFGKVVGYRGWSGGAYPEYSFTGPKVWVDNRVTA